MQQELQVPNRKIIISNSISSHLAEHVITQILDINDFDDHMASDENYNPQPIELYINSGGGSATDGFAIIGAMEMSETPIVTIGLGIVGSMALGIFAKGNARIAHRYTRFMYHSVAYGEMGYIKDHEDALIESDIIQQMYNDLFEGTGITKEMMKEIRNGKSNFFFSGKQAVKLGIADEIILAPQKVNFYQQQEQKPEE